MPRTAQDILSQEYLQVRAKILEVAAFYDRLTEAEAAKADPDQLRLLQAGCEILTDNRQDKAARVQLLFSREYDEGWRRKFGL